MKEQEKKEESIFEKLSSINVNDKVEKKEGLTYLSWAWAWSEVCKLYPNASYEILPTDFDETLGFMCHTKVTIEDKTLPMWLPVMDGKNKAMRKTPYKYMTKYGEKSVEAATTFDINKTIMRCLVKNLAMFGMGIYIYAGEDLPENEVEATKESKPLSKEELTPKHPNWAKAKEHLQTGGLLEDIERKYTISADNKKLLIAAK
jgi:hypothetical protein